MLIPTDLAFGLYCPGCGSLEVYHFSLFAIGRHGLVLRCPCGNTVVEIGRQKGKGLWIEHACVICGGRHLWLLPRSGDITCELVTLYCEDTGLEAAFVGSKFLVAQALRQFDRTLAELACDLGLTDGRVRKQEE